eukprot:948340_1
MIQSALISLLYLTTQSYSSGWNYQMYDDEICNAFFDWDIEYEYTDFKVSKHKYKLKTNKNPLLTNKYSNINNKIITIGNKMGNVFYWDLRENNRYTPTLKFNPISNRNVNSFSGTNIIENG